MCDYCGKDTIGEPMVSGYIMRMVCEHCGGSLDNELILTYKNLRSWALKYAISEGYILPKK